MIHLREMKDLKPYGVNPLTGEADGVGMRVLCDLSARGVKLLAKALGLQTVTPEEPWNRATPVNDQPPVGSFLLPRDLFTTLAVFALLETGVRGAFVVERGPDTTELWSMEGVYSHDERPDPKGGVLGDCYAEVEEYMNELRAKGCHVRRYGYDGTAGDRNKHQFSGRVT